MFKLIEKQLDNKLIKLSLIIGFIYCILFNSSVFIYKFDYYKATTFKAVVELGKDFIYIYLTLFIIFFGLTIHRLLFITGTIFLFLSGAAASYYLHFFKITPTKEVIESFFATDTNEAYELISTRLIVWLVFSVSISIYTIKHFTINNTKLFLTQILSAFCLLLTINSIIAPQYKILNSYFPIQYLHNTYLHFSKTFHASNRQEIHKKFTFVDNSPDDIIGVLIIGEAARFDHFGINGYERDTTPNLKEVRNLFSFDAASCSNVTHISVPCMLSRHSSKDIDMVNRETSILSVFTKLGFDTNWVATQTLIKYLKTISLDTIYDDVNFSITPGGSTLIKMNDHDEVMLPYIENIASKVGKRFLVIHTSGSHWNYFERYPSHFQRFNPGCHYVGKVDFSKADPSSCSLEGLINNYDNSILYTDFFLSNVIAILKDKYAFVIYASDHGESLGENGRYCHGGEIAKEQFHIPFIVWVSEKFETNHPEFVNAIQSHKNHKLSHDNIFHSILDCMGISSEAIDKNLSLCKPAV